MPRWKLLTAPLAQHFPLNKKFLTMQEDSEGGPRNQTQQQFFLFNLLLYLQICFVCQLFVGDKDNISP